MKKQLWWHVIMWVCLAVGALPSHLLAQDGSAPPRQFTFSWQYADDGAMAPRGGTTRGAPVKLATAAGQQWSQLRAPGLSAKERDRRAILAMAGPYRVSFDFIETLGLTEGYLPLPPYQSWATEYVYVVADTPDFISLQHIMVLRLEGADPVSASPMVMKHWRQDWRYEQREMHTFRGDQTWKRSKQPRSASRGRWVQSVYQVDDSPRYMAAGRWQHRANFSSWESDETWRPLPRREASVRDDYDVLIGTNTHTITPTGWVQEEFNLKTALDQTGAVESILARENGVARYERIEDYDWSAGDAYWAQTGPFWALVREQWSDYFADTQTLTVRRPADGEPLFAALFALAENTTRGTFDPDASRDAIQTLLQRYVKAG